MSEEVISGPEESIQAALYSSPDFFLAVLEALRVLSKKRASEAECGWTVNEIMEEIKSVNVDTDALGDLEAQIISSLLREAKSGVVERNGKLWKLSCGSTCFPPVIEDEEEEMNKSSKRAKTKRRCSMPSCKKRNRSKNRSRSRSRRRKISKEKEELPASNEEPQEVKEEKNEETEKEEQKTRRKRGRRKAVTKSAPATDSPSNTESWWRW